MKTLMSEMGYPQPSPKVFLINTMDAVQRLNGSGLILLLNNN